MTARDNFDIEKEATLIVDTLTKPHSEGSRQLMIGSVEKSFRRCQDVAYENCAKIAEEDPLKKRRIVLGLAALFRSFKTPEVGK